MQHEFPNEGEEFVDYINEEETYDEDPPFIVRGNGITCIALDELVEFLKKHSK